MNTARYLSLMLLLLAPAALSAATPLHVTAALDREIIEPLLAEFTSARPDIELHYHNLSTLDVDRLARKSTPDVVISSAMPWQMARVNEGLAQPLDTDNARRWPAWARWRNEVFGFTFEPAVIAYRLDLAQHMEPPGTHAGLHHLLLQHTDILRHRLTTYSPTENGVGYTLFQLDARYSPRFWDLVAAMGATGVNLENSTRAMLEGLSEGRYWVGYNLLGSYAMHWARTHPELIVQIPQDYTLVMMRMAFIHRDAPNPGAARIFLDFLLSARGQKVLAGSTPLFSIHPDVSGPYTARRLRDQVGDLLYPIPIDASLLAFVDPMRRRAFMTRWQREIRILAP